MKATEFIKQTRQQNKITNEMIFDRAMKIHNLTKGKGFIEGAKWMKKLLTKQ